MLDYKSIAIPNIRKAILRKITEWEYLKSGEISQKSRKNITPDVVKNEDSKNYVYYSLQNVYQSLGFHCVQISIEFEFSEYKFV